MGVTNAGDYNRVNGDHIKGRISGRIVEAVRAQVALLAASPAYSTGNDVNYEKAAQFAAQVLDRINGIAGIDMNGGTWYANASEIDNLGAGVVPAEVIWRSPIETNNNLETDNFPPSIYGNGRINPTQNLVDAFPMSNGYPISHNSFDLEFPYQN